MQLLKLWIPEPLAWTIDRTYREFIDSYGLKMKSLESLNFENLLSIDRPGIVNLVDYSGRYTALLTKINGTDLILTAEHGSRTIRYDEFIKNWDGSFKYLWKPPKGYGLLK